MIHQAPAQLYTASKRGHFENACQRWQATLNFEGYQEASRKPVGQLSVCNDETLGPNETLIRTGKNQTVLLLPMVGAVAYIVDGKTLYAEPNEAAWIPLDGDIILKNPYEDALVSFLYLVFNEAHIEEPDTVSINLAERNVLVPFSLPGNPRAKMGLFDGRAEALYTVKDMGNIIFVYVISGAFEVNGRLLEERDALALYETTEGDMEALSENALIILLELPA
jgi:quercetin 2,3-dioxygenase